MRLGLRHRVAAAFCAVALGASGALAGLTYVVVRQALVAQRENAAERAASAFASVVSAGLVTADRSGSEVLGLVSSAEGGYALLELDGRWYSTSLDHDQSDLPRVLVDADRGVLTRTWTRVDGVPATATAVPVPATTASLFLVDPATEATRTLSTLRWVLSGLTAVVAVAGAGLGAWAARAATRPLDVVGTAAARITAGDADVRLPPTDDPDLAPLVASFNAMLDTLAERVAREARFASDVSHELRTPMTAVVAAVDLVAAREADLPPAAAEAARLARAEVTRLHRFLEDLLDLARMDAEASHPAAADRSRWSRTQLPDLVAAACADLGHGPDLVRTGDAADPVVECDRLEVRRALSNLVRNADLHGGGVRQVVLERSGTDLLVHVDDAGPGVPPAARDRVFERFARLGARTDADTRGTGVGLGLALVRQAARRHGGDCWCAESPCGGARFTLRLPAADRSPS